MLAQGTTVYDVLIAWGPVLAPIFAAIAAVISAAYAKSARELAKHTDREVNNKNVGEPTLRQIIIDMQNDQAKLVCTAEQHGAILLGIQHALHENNARVRHILASRATFEADERGKYLWVSRHWADLMGVPLWDAQGRSWEEVIADKDRERVADEWFRAVENKESFGPTTFLISPRNREGTVRVVAEASPVRNSLGDLVGYVGSVDPIED